MDDIIKRVEAKWLKTLFNECASRFASIHLPSHDQWHHLRVWYYCRMLITSMVQQYHEINESDVEALIIAMFFHDQGMIKTMAKEHGIVSRQLCHDFFSGNKTISYIPSERLLLAIQEHDRKDYDNTSRLQYFDLQKIVNLADDLDAFGIIGIYRYLEIYLLRQILIPALPGMVLQNLELRYRYLCQSLVSHEPFLKTQQRRFETAVGFFRELQQQLTGIEDSCLEKVCHGPLGVANIIRNEIIEKKMNPDQVSMLQDSTGADDYSLTFFKALRQEYITLEQ